MRSRGCTQDGAGTGDLPCGKVGTIRFNLFLSYHRASPRHAAPLGLAGLGAYPAKLSTARLDFRCDIVCVVNCGERVVATPRRLFRCASPV
jgi:hypothetical protein